jgi:hypothetical protein
MPVPFEMSPAVKKLTDDIIKDMDPNAPFLPMAGLSKMLEDLCACGAESEYGAHWFENGEIHTAFLCSKCRHNNKKFT